MFFASFHVSGRMLIRLVISIGTLHGEVWSKFLLEHKKELGNLVIHGIQVWQDEGRDPSLVFHVAEREEVLANDRDEIE
jgi:hypothetical protein